MPLSIHGFSHPVYRAVCLAVWGVIVLGAQLGLASAVRAGCQHPVVSGVDRDAAQGGWRAVGLAGKWQYVGGKVYFLFYPQSPPCDGPGCRQSPDSQNQLSTIAISNDSQTTVAAWGTVCAAPTTSSIPLGGSTDPMAANDRLAQLLRPPIA